MPDLDSVADAGLVRCTEMQAGKHPCVHRFVSGLGERIELPDDGFWSHHQWRRQRDGRRVECPAERNLVSSEHAPHHRRVGTYD